MLITKKIEIDMGHRVTFHKSKCKNLHGHRYFIIVGVDDKVINNPSSSDHGMVIDFGDLKEIMLREIDYKLDHGFMLWDKDPFKSFFEQMLSIQPDMKVVFVPFVPTAENISKYIFHLIQPKLKERNIKLEYVEVYETPTSAAKYTLKNYLEDSVQTNE